MAARLTEEEWQLYLVLLKRFGKVPTWASKSAQFRELIHRLTEDLSFETRWDNEDWEEQPHGEE